MQILDEEISPRAGVGEEGVRNGGRRHGQRMQPQGSLAEAAALAIER